MLIGRHLYVEGEMFDVNGAGRLEYGWRYPHHLAGVRYDRHRFTMFLQSRISTTHRTTQC